jgi:hypothetical protein
VTRWQPRLELTRLFEALSEEIIAASDEEVGQIQGRTIAGTAREVRLLIKGARAGRDGDLAGLDEEASKPAACPLPERPPRGPHDQRH